MKTKIALLRGINVGGNRKIKMAELKEAIATLNLSEVKTYIQSGNIVFKGNQEKSNSESDNNEIALNIKQLILTRFKHEVPVVVFDVELLHKIIKINPYKNEDDFQNRLYISFLGAEPKTKDIAILNELSFEGDQFEIHANYVFILYKTKQSQSKLTNNIIEKKLGVQATTRNWKTVSKLLELSSN